MSDFPQTVKDLNPDERPQEKAEKFGVGVLSISELWAVILRSGQPGIKITDLTIQMMSLNKGKLRNLERWTRDDLMQLPGIGRVKAIQIEAVLEIMRRYNKEKLEENTKKILKSKDAFHLLHHETTKLNYEKIWIIFLGRQLNVIDYREVSSGGTSATVFDEKKIIRQALLINGCEGMVMVHNHPSGSLSPSVPDDRITEKLSEACQTLSLKLHDHIIIAGDQYYSYRDNGRIL